MHLPWYRTDTFEFNYLASLTHAGLKPLSRWEKPVPRGFAERLRDLDLASRPITRRLRSGATVTEWIFSRSEDRLEEYAARFANQPIAPSPENMRFEGRLFGYPECCVESFVRRGYARNSLRRADQRLLFHWACPGCTLTPALVLAYCRIYRACRESKRGGSSRQAMLPFPFFPGLARAASLAALGLSAALVAGPGPDDPHQLPLSTWEDTDQDGLTNDEESLLGRNPAAADEDGNEVLDGVDLARLLSLAIDGLPTKPSETDTYVVSHLTFGEETCNVCGASVNMGLLEIVRPLENQSVSVPLIAKHFLEHGSFSYDGTEHAGRVNVALLHTLLTATGPIHLLPEPAGSDADSDGLRDVEESVLGTDPEKPDTDGDQLLDGVDLARVLRARLKNLPHNPNPLPADRPYVIDHPMDGVETCPLCGERVVMDVWDVIHPVTHVSIRIPSMALHHLEHGGFTWDGGQLEGGTGRVDPRQLLAVLDGTTDGHQRAVATDADQDLLADAEETELGRNPNETDEDGNQVPDGVDLALQAAKRITQLPTAPDPKQVYRLDFPLRGVERCEVCGEWVNMGHVTLCNPRAELYCKLPYIAWHFLEHGSFDLAGNLRGENRTDVGLLFATLESTGPSHRQPAIDDADGDGLADETERTLGTDPKVVDTDGDGVPDGFDLARGFWRVLTSLPRTPGLGAYVVEHWANGLVSCPVCGTAVNRGCLELFSPGQEQPLSLSFLQLHFLQHGAWAVSEQECIDPADFQERLRPAAALQRETDHLELRWHGAPGRRYEVQTAAEPTGPWTTEAVLLGQGNELVYRVRAETSPVRRFYRFFLEGNQPRAQGKTSLPAFVGSQGVRNSPMGKALVEGSGAP